MPRCFVIFGYVIFFWSNENEPLESVHVHVDKTLHADATKIWILEDGSTELAHNHSRIPPKDLKRIMDAIERYAPMIVTKWERYFGEKARYKD